MRLLTDIKNRTLNNRRVLLRVDFNVPLGDDGRVDRFEDWRIRASLPTLRYLQKEGAIIILLAHYGRPGGRPNPALRLLPIYQHLAQLMNHQLRPIAAEGLLDLPPTDELKPLFSPAYLISNRGSGQPAALAAGDILGLENIRFHPGEKSNDPRFSQVLARLGSFYVNDAFANAHRQHASIVGLPRLMPSAAGLSLIREVEGLGKIIHQTRHPLVLILGGAKAATKLKFIKTFLNRSEHILTGGVIANALLAAKGIAIGQSVSEPPEKVAAIFKDMPLTSTALHLPVDVVVADQPQKNAATTVEAIGNIKKGMILDIGPDTIKLYQDIIKNAAMVVWNGTLGYAELKPFASGTEAMIRALARHDAYTVVGGGDTISFLQRQPLKKPIGYYSTGGGALLEFLAQGDLPGLAALRGNERS